MRFEFFITGRILGTDKAGLHSTVMRTAVFSIALSMAVMVMSLAVVNGFRDQITQKVIGFGSHIVINSYDANESYEANPINMNRSFYPGLEKMPGIRHIQVFGIKAGVIKSQDQIQGAVLKGVWKDFDWSFFKDKIIRGRLFTISDTGKSNEVIVSKVMSEKLNLKVNDKINMYFVQKNILCRRFTICGIYETGLEQFDNIYVLGDIRHVQKLNGWKPNEVAGFEVLINNLDDLDRLGEEVHNVVDNDLKAQTIREMYPQLFDWLGLVDTNAIVILVLMMAVAAITMISTLLILILERTTMIGILKALGSNNWSIRRIFIMNALYVTGKGLLWGNIVALALCLAQQKFGIIKLDEASYYVPVVPITLNVVHLLLLNAATLLTGVLVLLIPSFIISRITPVKAIRYS